MLCIEVVGRAANRQRPTFKLAMSVMVPRELHDLGFEFSNGLDRHLSLNRHERYRNRYTDGVRDSGGTLTRSAARARKTRGLTN